MDAAYVAGFFDGEGSIGLYGKRLVLRVCITQARSTAADVLFDAIQSAFGGKVGHSKQYNPQHRPAMMWFIYGDAAATFLKVIRPHLRLKAEQADLAIEWQAKRPPIQRDSLGRIKRSVLDLDIAAKLKELKKQ